MKLTKIQNKVHYVWWLRITVAAVVPWMVTNDNHERFYDWVAYINRLKLLLELHDGDSHCGFPCVSYITDKLMDGRSLMQWSFFQEMIKKIYGLTARPTARLSAWLTCRMPSRLSCRLPGWLSCRLSGRLAGRFTSRLSARLSCRLAAWLA